MKQREVCKYIYDVVECCKRLTEFTAGKTVTDYRESAMLRSAVERQFEIIGEAVGKLLKLEPALETRISGSRRIISFRNLLIHGYADVDDDLVWGIVETQLNVLKTEIEQLLSECSDQSSK
jgi:uncharacterized protein with HEPN domain